MVIALRGDVLTELSVPPVDTASDWATAIRFFPQGRPGRASEELPSSLDNLLGTRLANSAVRVVPILGMGGQTGRQLHIARITDFGHGTLIGIHRLPDLPSPWPEGAPTISPRSIWSLATRCMREAHRAGDLSVLGRAIAVELTQEVTRLLDEQMDLIVALVASAALEDEARTLSFTERQTSFTALVEARVRIQRVRTVVRREGVEDAVVAQLDSVIGGLDSAASALVGIASTVMGEAIARADAAERARDRRITLIATALLLPALLFALLGINWIPTQGFQEWWVMLVVLAAGTGLGCFGWWLGKRLFGSAADPVNAGSEVGAKKERKQ